MQLQPKSNEKLIVEIVERVRYVEFLRGVPVELPSETKELLRSGIRKALAQKDKEVAEAVKAERERIINLAEGEPYIYVPNITEANPSTK